MTRIVNRIIIGLLGLSLTSCSWLINLIVANHSDRDILVRYLIPSDSVNDQFYRNPKTYRYSRELLELYKLDERKRPVPVSSDVKMLTDTQELEVRLAPGQALHVGYYASFQSRREIISKYELRVQVGKDSILTAKQLDKRFSHWKNIRTDLLEID